MMKKRLSLLLAVSMLLMFIVPLGVSAEDELSEVTALNAYIMDYDTGETLYAREENEQLPVASIAKMMSVYVLLDKIKNGELSLDTIVPISENVYNLSRVPDYKMMVNLEYDEQYTLDEMIDMIVIDSAAACVTATAELASGSEADFVELMNEKAKEIGIDSVFYNGTGVCLNPETDKENLMSAKDAAIMARRMIQDYPEILERTKQASVEFHGSTYYNLNKLFSTYPYEGADGFKNGMTEASGYCMCGTAERDGKRVITVALRCVDNDARFTDTIAMFDYGFEKLDGGEQEENVSDNNDEIKVMVDGSRVEFEDQEPVIIDGRTLVPLRGVMEKMGKQVDWDGEQRMIKVYDDAASVTLWLDNSEMVMVKADAENEAVNTELDVPPMLIGERTCLPIRAVAESFGAEVDWDGESRTVIINTAE